MTKDEALRLALKQAYNLGQIYWQQADSEYMSQHRKADLTEAKFKELLETTVAALEAKDEPMEFFDWYDNAHWGNEDFKEGCHRAWNAAIKYTAKPNQEAKDEPVAWMCADESLINKGYARFSHVCMGEWKIPVYTTPPQRTWVGLTDEEMLMLEETTTCTKDESWLRNLTQAIEAKLKEKNG